MRTEERAAPAVSAQRPVTAVVGGAFIVVCAVVAAVSVKAPESVVDTYAPRPDYHYSPVLLPLVFAWAAVGLVVMTRHRWTRPAAVAAAILAAPVAGNGLTAIHNWFTFNGLGGLDGQRYNLVALHAYAVLVVLAATAATVVAAAMVWREPAGGWRSLVPARPGYVVAGAALAVMLPVVWDPAGTYADTTGFAHICTVTYALPWGAGLAAVGWLRGRAARAAGLTVAVCAVVCTAIAVGDVLYTFYSTPPGD
jgi:hypothetical protein